jgi:hypothetical protein
MRIWHRGSDIHSPAAQGEIQISKLIRIYLFRRVARAKLKAAIEELAAIVTVALTTSRSRH